MLPFEPGPSEMPVYGERSGAAITNAVIWDAAGAKAFGYPMFSVNRLKLPLEELGEVPDGRDSDFSGLVRFLAQ